MAVRDFEAFIRERALLWDPNLDVNPGSPFDTQVIQPVVRRLGTDPFSVDLSTFAATRMQQAFPDIASMEEDAVTDLLIKPATLLFDPIVREIGRVKQNLSFADPSQLTTEEADALGANVFSSRRRGAYARGMARIYFRQPQNVDIAPSNFVTSRKGRHYFPTQTQRIRTDEMLLNKDSEGLYYFDVTVIAEKPGDDYNIGPNELMSVANVPSAIKVRNLRKFSRGIEEESAQDFCGRAGQELTERSMTTLRGASAKLVNSFPEIDRLNIVGTGDPEMRRDVIKGGGLGDIIVGGTGGLIVTDGEGATLSRRFYTIETNFIELLGGIGPVTGYVLTVFDAFGGSVLVRDLVVRRVVDINRIDVEDQVFVLASNSLRWALRKKELTLTDIPGGILYPDGPFGTVSIPDSEVHIGGMFDTYIKGTSNEETSFIIENVTDDEPSLSGVQATVTSTSPISFKLGEYVSGTTFDVGDETDQLIDAAVRFGYTLQIQDNPEAGNYRVVGRSLSSTGEVQLQVTPDPSAPTLLNMRYRLFDDINIDLLNPKETRVSGDGLITLQNSNVVRVPAGVDFVSLGVSQGDVLRILSGKLQGDYTITAAPLSATSVQVDTALGHTLNGLSYTIYRSNEEALIPPFIRVSRVELLDSSSQPIGTIVPYAKPVDVQSRTFQNPARGVKHEFRECLLGLVSKPAVAGFFTVTGTQLKFYVEGLGERDIPVTAGVRSINDLIGEIGAGFLMLFGLPEVVVAVGTDRFGIRPVGVGGYVALIGGSSRTSLFGDTKLRTTGDIQADVVWSNLIPSVDMETGLDVVQVLDGVSVGNYAGPFTTGNTRTIWPSALAADQALNVGVLTSSGEYLPRVTFAPESGRWAQVGSRSIGSARVYFLEPTSFEIDAEATFSADLGTQGVLTFVPDPTLDYQCIPAKPGGAPAQDGVSASSSNVFLSAEQDFVQSGVQPGDKLVIENIPLEGSQFLTDPVVGIAGLTLVFSLDDDADRTVIFMRDDESLDIPAREVSRVGIVEQINAAAGEEIVELTTDFRLRFSTHKNLTVRGTGQGTANATILGIVDGTAGARTFAGVSDVSNVSPHTGTYEISFVGVSTLTLTDSFDNAFPFISPIQNQSFKVLRTGVQRISTTEMNDNVAEAGLYYFDVELVSEGTGDLWNIDAGMQLTAEGYRSDGYYLTTDDSNLSFSELERPKMVISRSILELGVDDNPVNATQITGENIQITYERSALVADVQNFISAETERVVCANPLSRHLTPNFVRMDVVYSGGSKEDIVLEDLEAYTEGLSPIATLDASHVQKLVVARGATYVKNPLDLISVVHNPDRTVWVHRSQDQLSSGRLSAFIPDRITVARTS